MIALLVAALLTAEAPGGPDLSEIANAIDANRLVQARRMLADALAAGCSGPELDRLFAHVAFADQRWTEAQSRYLRLIENAPDDTQSVERAGIATIMLGDTKRGRELIQRAISSGRGTWQAWNALGVLSDLEGDWNGADAAYATAQELSPNEPKVLNNHGWSLILRGEWESAVRVLERAATLEPGSRRIANNLELARAALDADLPKRRDGESSSDFAARLNDAGVAAEKSGDRARAIAAFTRALAVSDSWYARAANNLARIQAN